LAFDFDGVIADDEAEKVYLDTHDLKKYHDHEVEHANDPLKDGLLADLLKKISFFQKLELKKQRKNPEYKRILKTSIVTARNAPSHERMINTLKNMGVEVNEAFFLGGIEKSRVLNIMKPHLFFDDQMGHLKHIETVPAVHIPFGVVNKKREHIPANETAILKKNSMTKAFFLICIACLGLVVSSCTKTKQDNNSSSGTSVNTEKDRAADNQAKNTAAQVYAKQQVPVLCYHRISNGNKGDYTVSPATFSAHMKVLADSGYHSISPAQLYDYLVYNKTLPEKPVMITFDDSRVEHTLIAAPAMEKQGFRGVFFIMTITYNKKNYMTKDQIAGLAKAGHTIGLHSWDHTMVTKYKEAADWQKEVVEPKAKLEKIVGRPVDYWAYPNGVFDHKGAQELSKYFKLSFSLSTKRDSLLPLQTVRRIIVPDCTPQRLMKSIHGSFGKLKSPANKNYELRGKTRGLKRKFTSLQISPLAHPTLSKIA
jgi:peptidoglycan/xylan/chitin deacetylase (PgdA/CDA1 family)